MNEQGMPLQLYKDERTEEEKNEIFSRKRKKKKKFFNKSFSSTF